MQDLICTVYLFVFAISFSSCRTQPTNAFNIPVLTNYYPEYVDLYSAYYLALDDINNNTSILPNTKLGLNILFSEMPAETLSDMISLYEGRGTTFMCGFEYEDNAIETAKAASIYGIAQLSSRVATSELSNNNEYPNFSRTISSGKRQVDAIIDVLRHFSAIRGPGWTDVAILSTTSIYGTDLAELFIEDSREDFTVRSYQQVLEFSTITDVELSETQKSGARVILAFFFSGHLEETLLGADKFGMIGENYVWVSTDSVVGALTASYMEPEVQELARGLIGTVQEVDTFGPLSNDPFTQRWISLDDQKYPGAGFDTFPDNYARLVYDSVWVAALAIHNLIEDEGYLAGELERIPPEIWTKAIRQVEYHGVSGTVTFDDNGDRNTIIGLYYFSPEVLGYKPWAGWDTETALNVFDDVVWFSNTTSIPDLDIRTPFDYWSCYDKEERTDKTGKKISLHTPGGSNVNEIDSHYHCDNFIDCNNLSDESEDCPQNYLILFIVFGIVTALLICVCLVLLVFVLIYGIVLKYQRLRVSSPLFLIVMLLSMIIGYFSIFAWFGKPHPVACGFQPWLLGLPAISMISAMCAKTYRIWKIFKSELRKQKITDLKLVLLWLLAMIPAIFILVVWTIVSTPTAAMRERDGEEHYVCTTGGFTGEPGGYVFFGILVAYGALVLMIGVFLSIVTRKVPSLFNESKLLAISIYNLGFLSAVIIPVFLVIQAFNPFIAWILRTIAILYAFTATLVLQFAPVVVRIILIDRFKNIKTNDIVVTTSSKFLSFESK